MTRNKPKSQTVPEHKKAVRMTYLRLTDEQHRRLKECSEYLGKTMMNVIRDGLLREMERVEKEMEDRAEKKRMARKAHVPRTLRQWDKPTGLGIDPEPSPSAFPRVTPSPLPALLQSPPEPAPPSPPPARPRAELDVERFVAYVAAAESEEDQRARIEQVARILGDTSSSEEEAQRVLDHLRERVQALLPFE